MQKSSLPPSAWRPVPQYETTAEEPVEATKGIPSFTETMDSFLILAEKVLHYDTSGELIVQTSGQASGIQMALNGYKMIYDKTRDPPTKHIEKMKEVYAKCRSFFLRDTPLEDFMKWLGDESSFVIAPSANSRNRLYLTSIFRNCSRIASHIADKAARSPEQAEELYNNPAAVYPEYFTLYLLRMFYHCAGPSDRETLIAPRIKELEKMLNLAEDEVPIISDGLSELMSMAGELASDMGLEVPKNAGKINGTQLKQAMGEWTKNADMKSTLKSFFEGVDLKNTKDFPSAIGMILGKMQETAQAIPEPVQRSLNATADD